MSQKEVIASERGISPADRNNGTILYLDSTGDAPYGLQYIFLNNKLVSVARLLLLTNPKENRQYKEYINEKDLLVKRMGKPNISQEQINNSFIGNEDLYSYCVKLGECRFWLQWMQDRTGVILSLEEKDGNPLLGVFSWDRAQEQNIVSHVNSS